MGRETLGRPLTRRRERCAVEDLEERIEGTGEAYLDPAYNGRYEAEREMQRLSELDEESDENESLRADPPRSERC